MKFSSKTFENQVFQTIFCPKQDLRHKEFSNCTFKKCDLSECNFSSSSFIDCIFIDCNLSNIKVDNVAFQNVSFENCKLLGIVFIMINPLLIKWSFKESAITLCNFSNLDMKGTKFFECAIRDTDFIDTNLANCDFSNSDLQASKFQNANLEKANLVGAKNYYIDPTCNKLKQARFSYPDVLSLLTAFGIKVEY